ncbi:MAG: hypothetical protein MUF33_11700 [Candidatus Nanopelagicales bacterium]|jgi:hypothetical protein|nr:hypothetical protein [Candidatus Nanopelagicales bacterium]MCU0299166.1 hypothetical protein [Candidatus Nanopelagicales bacterium]
MKTATLATLALVLTATPANAAGSEPSGTIAYTKDFNVFGTSPNGATTVRFTTQGTSEAAYGSASLNDAGTLLTVRGPANSAQQINPRTGQVINSGLPHMDSGGLPSGLGEVVANPAGDEIAYSYLRFSGYPGWTTDTCVGITPPGASVQLRQWCGIYSPHWWNGQLIVSNERDVGIADPGSASGPTVILAQDGDLWWTEADVTRSGDAMLAVASVTSDVSYLDWVPLSRNGNVLTPVESGHCTVPADKPLNPTFSPDGDHFAWENADGIAVSTRPNGVAADGMCTFPGGAQPRLLVPGGSSPSWSSASIAGTATKLVALPKNARGAKKVTSRTPKVCVVVGKAKAAKLKVLKTGRCKLKVIRGSKTALVAFKVRL